MVFPGMGPLRFADVGKFLLLNPYARELVAVADARLGHSLVDRLREAEDDYSDAAQVAFLVTSVALAHWAENELGVTPTVCAGPSFGEKSATAYVQSLPFEDAVWMTAELARCLTEYFATAHTDVVTCSYARVPGERLTELLADLDARGEWAEISCHVDDDLFMVSLREHNADWLTQQLRSLGALPLYTMRPPMHAAAFGGLRRKAEDEVLGALPFADPELPVVADQDGSVVRTGEGMRTMLLDSIVRPMRWPDVVASLRRQAVGRVCVAGPDALFGRVRCTTEAFEVLPANPALALRPRRRGAAAP
ncbi:ACP S-malonyltransferase [Streptomyces sp. M2CJ-2]|uniref:ACP S-malonyltransferase n=1 Tax=Streptomyces sp. M2CJ-2 TaxID=2803948 RepID=UPI001926D8E0|nr:ACP S-malonyltransferase [Streptomyces sp. M2CJ-2]MBL3671355.1 ACP S-malonyltransferase [Streptomyces sp. M2CJ-2]